MKNYHVKWGLKLAFVVLFSGNLANAQTPVEQFGQLKVSGNKILGANNTPVQLRGMSFFWSQWIGKYYNANVVKWLRDDWCVSIVRAAMAVDNGGYATSTAEKNKIFDVIDAAIANGVYVLVDFHVHDAPTYKTQAKTFFAEVATKYGNQPNIIYEIWNEPLDVSWTNVIRPYHNELVQTIRAIDPDNIIVCGTRLWSQRVDEAANNPVTGTNIVYTLHYYANSHGQELRDYCTTALNKNVAVFVTEYGTCDASGDGTVNAAESNTWWTYLDNNKISYCNWAVSDKAEAASALKANSSTSGSWTANDLTTSGTLVRNYYKSNCVAAASNYKIYKTPTPIVIDGTIDDVWNEANVLPQSFNNLLLGTVSNTADLSGTFKALWDNTYLYILGDVKDDTKTNDSQNGYDDDAVEVFIDINNDKSATYAANDVSYTFGWNDGAIISVNPAGRSTANISYSITAQSGGYVFEGRIPWSTLQGTPAVGQLLGFDFHVNDDDNGGTRDGKLGWTATTDDSWQNPSLFGTAVLSEELVFTWLDQFQPVNNISVFPNPSSSSFSIQSIDPVQVKVFDNLGRLMSDFTVSGTTNFGSEYSAGIYHVLLMDSDGEMKTLKMIKEY